MRTEETLSITNTTKGKLPRLPFVHMKDKILGKTYDLSVAFVGPTVSRNLNRMRRGKDYATNVLSFSLTKKTGELIICPSVIKKQTKEFGMPFSKLLTFLVIHGMLHLEGHTHGSTMESAEKKYMKQFTASD